MGVEGVCAAVMRRCCCVAGDATGSGGGAAAKHELATTFVRIRARKALIRVYHRLAFIARRYSQCVAVCVCVVAPLAAMR